MKLIEIKEKEIDTKNKYLELFKNVDGKKASDSPDPKHDSKLLEKALKNALDTRKFEIDLYWKRTTYFWAFSAAIFASFFLVVTSDKILNSNKPEAMLFVSAVGFIFSLGWFLANKGSKYWQENWEYHVALLEDTIQGPLHKTILKDKEKTKWYHIFEPQRFSVSKINQILSFFLFIVWIFLLVKSFCEIFKINELCNYSNTILIVLLIIVFFYLLFGITKKHDETEFKFIEHKVED